MADGRNELDHLLIDLESNDSGSIATVLRAISERDEREHFLDKLTNRIKDQDQQIEDMCNLHHENFIDCIRELQLIRPTADSLKKDTMNINTDLMKSTDGVQRRTEDLIKARRILVNSSSSIDLLRRCLSVLDQYSKFNTQFQAREYLLALKTLDLLETTYLPTVSRYRFAQNMCKEVPEFRLLIKNAAKKDLNDFLEGILVKSQEIGEMILKQNWDSDQLFERPSEQQPANALSLIDFSPVYRGLHIFENLSFKDEFKSYYKEEREKQSRLAFSFPPNTSNSLKSYTEYFGSIIGFFVIEDHLIATTKDFIQSGYLNDLWSHAIASMENCLIKSAKSCQDTSLMLKLKKLMMLFIFTISNYGHKTDALGGILVALRDQYDKILMTQWLDKFRDIFRHDNYHPLEVSNEEEYLKAIGALTIYETGSVKFPKKFPFSLFVPKVYEEVRSFIEQSLIFSQDLNSSQADVENMVRKSTNQLLTQTLGSCLKELINDSSLKLLQLIQITINTNHLEDLMQYLDNYITMQTSKSLSGFSGSINSSTTPTTNSTTPNGKANQLGTFHGNDAYDAKNAHVKLEGKSMFKDARAEAESQIYKKLNDMIDEFLSLAGYDWTAAEASGQASSFISDLIAWLQSTFQAFTNLPQRVAQGACMSACKHIAQSLRELLLSDENKALSHGGLMQFNLDLIQCEVFANSDPVRGFKEGDLQMAFAELRQICDLFLYEDYNNYMSDMGKQQNKYLRVTTATALIVVDKLREFDRKKTVFAIGNLTKNDKQKLRDLFSKKLRQIRERKAEI